jgi:lysozyme
MLSHEETVIQNLLIEDEGMELLPYFDCCGKFFRKCDCNPQGKLTIGIGRNIEDIGISENEAIGLLLNDIERVTSLIEKSFPWFEKLSTPRRIVIVCMVFNMGLNGVKEFEKMIRCIESGDFECAAQQMLDSDWASQVKNRAVRLAQIMKTGQI